MQAYLVKNKDFGSRGAPLLSDLLILCSNPYFLQHFFLKICISLRSGANYLRKRRKLTYKTREFAQRNVKGRVCLDETAHFDVQSSQTRRGRERDRRQTKKYHSVDPKYDVSGFILDS